MDREKRIMELVELTDQAISTRERDEFAMIKHPPSMWQGFLVGIRFALRGILPAGAAGFPDQALLQALILIAQEAGDPQMVDHLKAFTIRKMQGMPIEEPPEPPKPQIVILNKKNMPQA